MMSLCTPGEFLGSGTAGKRRGPTRTAGSCNVNELEVSKLGTLRNCLLAPARPPLVLSPPGPTT